MNKWHGSKWINPIKRLAIYLRDDFTCIYCLRELKNADSQEVTLDHIVPKSKGGSNSHTNLVCSCKTCNSSRKNISIYKFTDKETIKRIKKHRYRSLKKYLKKAKEMK